MLNGHNFGPKRSTGIKKKSIEKAKCRLPESKTNFVRSLKFEVMSQNDQSGKCFISLADSSFVFAQDSFFISTESKLLESLSFKLQIHFSVDSVRFFWRSYFTLNK